MAPFTIWNGRRSKKVVWGPPWSNFHGSSLEFTLLFGVGPNCVSVTDRKIDHAWIHLLQYVELLMRCSLKMLHKCLIVVSAKWTKWMSELLFSFDVCLCVCVCNGPVDQTSLKWLKLRTSNLTCMFPGTVRTWPCKNFSNRGVARVTWPPKFLGVKC